MNDYTKYTIGVLSLQGAVSEHIAQIETLGAKAIAVKSLSELQQVDALVLPGGESTAMRRLMHSSGLFQALKSFDKPILGTCAGLILLANKLEGGEPPHLAKMNIQVQRNAFGRQVDSFQTDLMIKGFADSFPAVFIRAPYISRIGSEVEVLAEWQGNVVFAKQGNLLACAFHPELTSDTRVVELFLQQLKE
ncbi:pyridoxal 5'-phosphate synthase glutaminase subunit PdxT [Actinobacillus pleuropneumoniae]|uniref:Pyridoxal 5'-phosphate synthase subunit PdxT n=1 Tax=Actinobacillus pleuropneumoniae serotype 5b (strain L20) TaxID=416269 RepID=PDXT_ACTP2|nr:pyridoxal 5'-phosphate synthase glutaminase subunit PdxT [Actinobacillus pleuropneumoniae]A3MZT9.1 RecName: Full=Pyridoxal 5'-phosphate synthase subunit PdxT; AltName: Full=Pdx2; AltName: Full=Pyridoxal 5'-phosphate synthase glutaminase subunit [Actinobacillus pleuropneumoniae serovar 5b str. L20]ABN73675.1 glutamine amidotransferase subunit PdxT [Actinobacillus pleuropneumoniae serovar 5b str. L20]EFM96907.1 Glutamine amidotransferase subunit pdxT [Actinobacillus pleuropneumoniae serovar 10 